MQIYALNERRYKFWPKSEFNFFRIAKSEDEMGPNFKVWNE